MNEYIKAISISDFDEKILFLKVTTYINNNFNLTEKSNVSVFPLTILYSILKQNS